MHGCHTVHGRANVLMVKLMEPFIEPRTVEYPVCVEVIELVVYEEYRDG